MNGALPPEMIFAVVLVVIASVGSGLAWLVARRLEAWSERRKRRRGSKPSVEFRAIANWMVRPEQIRRKKS
jgi:hypothetical protein